ncbi:hypothetical protein [Sphingomonas sp. R86520]|uniref:hypothetical protein n=1 Tax=Sphingomonas sp. R86520 TaxID=3093859 RepID=UPI0036D3CC8D
MTIDMRRTQDLAHLIVRREGEIERERRRPALGVATGMLLSQRLAAAALAPSSFTVLPDALRRDAVRL